MLIIRRSTQRTIHLYAHMIAPIGPEGVTNKQFRAIWKVQEVANSLVRMFGGKADSSGDGSECVQYDDTIVFDDISDVQMEFILHCHPFISEINKPFILRKIN